MKRLAVAGLLLAVLVLLGKVFAHPAQNEFSTLWNDTNGETFAGYQSGVTVTNLGATGNQIFNLPPAVAGMRFTFVLAAAQTIDINPQNDDKILGLGLTTSAGDAIRSNSTVGTAVDLVALDATNWLPVSFVGAWTDVN